MNTSNILKRFHYQSKPLNVIKYHGMAWFYVSDVIRILGYSRNALYYAHISPKDQFHLKYRDGIHSGYQGMWGKNDYSTKRFLDKSGLYKFCDYAGASRFKDWLSHKPFLGETVDRPRQKSHRSDKPLSRLLRMVIGRHEPDERIHISALHFFDFNGHQVLTAVIRHKLYFYGNSVASILGYVKTRNAIDDYVDKHDQLLIPNKKFARLSSGRSMPWKAHDFHAKRFITESGVYSLCLSSRLPRAKKFKYWVTHDVLPSINHTGSYITHKSWARNDINTQLLELLVKGKADTPQALRLMGRQISLLADIKEQRDKFKAQEEYDHPAAEHYRGYINNPSLMNTTMIAKDYGLSARELNKILSKYHVIYRQGKHWIFYKNVAKDHLGGYQTYRLKNGIEVTSLQWTGKGRLVIFGILNRLGYKPNRPIHQYPKSLLKKAGHYLQTFSSSQRKLK